MELLLPFVLLATMHSSAQADRVEAGEWGGRGARLTVREDGATVELDCAHGTVETMTLGQDGHFDVAGRFAREHGGPVLRDEKDESVTARYRGSVHEQTMTLEIVPEGSGETVGPFELTRGGDARLRKCR